MVVADVNVLIYAHRRESPDHRDMAAWLDRTVGGREPFGCSEQALFGFVRIVTNAKVFIDPTPLSAALAFVDQLLARRNCVRLRPGARHWSIFAELCRHTHVSSKLIADAHHAALAIEHGCELITTDSDFARFKGLRWRHPLAC